MADNFFGLTDTGRMRDNNEDAFIAEKLPTGWIVACVIDGVGGYEGGEVAADIARATLLQKLKTGSGDVLTMLRDALQEANRNIYNEKQSGTGKEQMACVLTVALCDVEHNQAFYAHVGDTRLYLLRDASLVKLSKDHSFVGFLEDSGRLSEREAMAHPKRNEINKALGFDAQIDLRDDYIETGSSPFLPADTLMLCSDGLTDLVNADAMRHVLAGKASLSQKAKSLIDAANAAGGKDNITVVLVQNNRKPQKQRATKPFLVKKNESGEPVTALEEDNRVGQPKAVKEITAKPKGLSSLWLLLPLLILAGVCLWLWRENNRLQTLLPTPPVVIPRGEAEAKLANSLDVVSRELILSRQVLGNTIRLTDTLYIRQDSLRIDGGGTVLQADSSFTGPAFFVSPNNKFLLLENVTFSNFQTALLLQGRGVQLRNVRFQNCVAPILRRARVAGDSALNGFYRDTLQLKKDSLPK